jgi:hypothetical protein
MAEGVRKGVVVAIFCIFLMIDPIPAGLHTFYTSPHTIREQEAGPRHNSFGQAIVI